ncbi:hypothetical protein [Qipengyuania sp. JC766]|uniref:hypothetical protein n=1 Tax=Qipengyuania sp. JC766 TaxID=3232139 RepID=UPI003457AC05
MINRLRWCLAGALTASGLFLPVQAIGKATGGFNISVSVPEYCDIRANDFKAQSDGDFVVGEVFETCNHSRGFQVLASHRSLADEEQVEVDYGGIRASLERTGLSSITFRAGPRYGAVPVKIAAKNLTEVLQVSFSLTPV